MKLVVEQCYSAAQCGGNFYELDVVAWVAVGQEMFTGQVMADMEILKNRIGEESRALALWRGAGPAGGPEKLAARLPALCGGDEGADGDGEEVKWILSVARLALAMDC